jgi:hypothetical protein
MARPSPKSISSVRASKQKIVHGDHVGHLPGDENIYTKGEGPDPGGSGPDTVIGPGAEAHYSKGTRGRKPPVKGGTKLDKGFAGAHTTPHHTTHHVPSHMKHKGKK